MAHPTKSPDTSMLLLAGLDAALLGAVLLLSSPFAGIGLEGFALLPVILAWYLFLMLATLAAFPLGVLCLRKPFFAPLGLLLFVLAVLNIWQIERWYSALQPTKAERVARDAESQKADEIYRCTSQWFSVSRRVESVDGNELVFAGGGRIDVCRRNNRLCGGDPSGVARREAFGAFAKAHLQGAEVTVTLDSRPFFRYSESDWCGTSGSPAVPTLGFQARFRGDVDFRGKRVTVTESPLRIEDFR